MKLMALAVLLVSDQTGWLCDAHDAALLLCHRRIYCVMLFCCSDIGASVPSMVFQDADGPMCIGVPAFFQTVVACCVQAVSLPGLV